MGANSTNLAKLDDRHKQVASLLAQGVARYEIAAVTGYHEDYVSRLMNDPLFIDYMDTMVDFANKQMEAMFCKTVQRVGEALDNGTHEEALKAARLQLEVTNRVGSKGRSEGGSEDTINRLTRLAERLATLNQTKGLVIDGQAIPIPHPQLGYEGGQETGSIR